MSDRDITDTQARGQALSGDPQGGEIAPDTDDAPGTQSLPLDAWHRARGGRMVEFAGYWMPVQFDGIMAEHLWTREHAGLFDVSHMGQLFFSGYGVEAALETLMPADIAGYPLHKARYSLLLAENGGILDDLMLTRIDADANPNPFAVDPSLPDAGWSPEATAPVGDGSGVYMVVNGATKWDDIAHFREHLDDSITLNHLDDRALLALQGPEAAAVLDRLIPGVAALTFMQAGPFVWSGHDLWISRSGYTGEDGYELSIPADAASAFADALCADASVRPIGLGARDSLRLEAGLPLYGHDLDPDTTPVMADLGFALSKRRRDEGGFPGYDRIMAERAGDAVVKRVGLLVEGRQPVRESAVVLDAEGSTVGRVVSGGFAPTVGQPIAMAYVPTALAVPGTAITLSQRGKLHRAVVSAMPFVPHRYVRTGGK